MENAETGNDKFAGWIILELMGHRRLTEHEIAGRAFLRIDVPSEPPATQFYGAEAVYCITPTTEEIARAAAKLSSVAPIHRWELPPPAAKPADTDYADADLIDESPGWGG